MIRKIIEATFPSAASNTFRISSGHARSADIRLSAVRTSCGPRRWWFPPPAARTSVRPIDVLNALLGFCSSAAAQSRPARFSR
jgi:hypothetical protein